MVGAFFVTTVTEMGCWRLHNGGMSSLTRNPQAETQTPERAVELPRSGRETPGAGYFSLTEMRELNSGYYHDTVHALEVAELVKQLLLNLGRRPARAEFLRQIALIHDADPRLCGRSGECRPGTPARVQVTLSWMEARREWLESRFGWEGLQFEEACALIARTDYPFDRMARTEGTRFDGMSPVDVYRDFLWKLPRELRRNCFVDALVLRFADQTASYVGSYERACCSVMDLARELRNAGIPITPEQVGKKTVSFLSQVGLDLTFDRELQVELNMRELSLPTRTQLLSALGWQRRWRLAWNSLKFRFTQ